MTAASLFGVSFLPLEVRLLPVFGAVVFGNAVAATVMAISIDRLMAFDVPDALKGQAGGWSQAGNLGGTGLGGGAGLWLAQHTGHPWIAGVVLSLTCLACAAPLIRLAEPGRIGRTLGYLAVLKETVADVFTLVKRRIGIQLQAAGFYPYLTLTELLEMFGVMYGVTVDPVEMLRSFDLEEKREAQFAHLSGGQKQRFSLATTLVNTPRVIFLDEPTTGLDPQARINLWDVIRQVRERGVTVVLTTHYMDEAEQLCDRLAIMDRGVAKAVGTPASLKSQIGGDVITLQSPDPDAADKLIRERLSLTPTRIENTLRLEHPDGPHLIPQLVSALGPTLVDSVSVGKPTLQDVFIRVTGHRLASDEPATPTTTSHR